MNRSDLMFSLIMAGRLKRYHTLPTITQQTIADHTWGVMRVYVGIFGPPEIDVWVYMLLHDVAELHTGDLPYPVKQKYPDLAEEIACIEAEALKDLGVKLPPISDTEKTYIKISDLIEMHQFGMFELNMGNQFAHPIMMDTLGQAYDIADAAGCRSVVSDYLTRRPYG